MDDGAVDLLTFARRVLALLDGGRRVATYKLAVLLALTDCCSGGIVRDDIVHLRDLAARVMALYWPMVRLSPFTGRVLRQSEQPIATIVSAVGDLRARANVAGTRSLLVTESRVPHDFEECLEKVAQVLASEPLPKLQRPQGWRRGDPYPRPLYDDSAYPAKSASLRKVRDGSYDIRLHPGVAGLLSSLGGLIRPLLELAWARQVAELNDLPEDDLMSFLFGTERAALEPVRLPLLDLQHGLCFYCGRRMKDGEAQVDHFLPWARLPEDGLVNLVAADAACNNAKSDLLAAPVHAHNWLDRDLTPLGAVAAASGWPLRRRQTWAACRVLYQDVPAGLPLWNAATGPDRRVLANPTALQALLIRLNTV